MVRDEFFVSQPSVVGVDVVVGTGMIGDPCEPLGCPQFSICQGGTCVPRGGCGALTEAGSDMPETHVVELGQPSGTFDFQFETFLIADKLEVFYEGQVLFDTGCVGANGTESLTYSGQATAVTVQITPNCSGNTSGTAWEFLVDCP